MIIAITDQAGNPLGAYRMPDATVFSFDVAVTKARNAYYFSTPEGYRVLKATSIKTAPTHTSGPRIRQGARGR